MSPAQKPVRIVRHSIGGAMVFGCMAFAGIGNLVFVENTMNQNVLQNKMKQCAIPDLRPVEHLWKELERRTKKKA